MTEIQNRSKHYTDNRFPEAARILDSIGRQILRTARDELYFSMRFLDVALSSLGYEMDPEISPAGTDGRNIYFHSRQLGGLYKENRILVNRLYLHMVLHCIFRHITKRTDDLRYWNLSCDIAAEHIIDGCDLRPVRFSRSLLRRETYRKLEAEKHVLNAERVFRILKGWELAEKDLAALEEEFRVDDHRYWEDQDPKRKPDPDMNRRWQEISEKMETDMETFSKEAAEHDGDLLGELKVENRERYDYREFRGSFP
mgnify:CR=1 FL=1